MAVSGGDARRNQKPFSVLQVALAAVAAADSSQRVIAWFRTPFVGIGASPVLDAPPGGKSGYGFLAATSTTFKVIPDTATESVAWPS